MTDPVPRETQINDALLALERTREMGWGHVTVEVTRGGTLRIEVQAEDGTKMPKHVFTTGRK